MTTLQSIKRKIRRYLPPYTFLSDKEAAELGYWSWRVTQTQNPSSYHYSYFYTSFFDLAAADYAGKIILDVGCGPRGSLEWATMAKERIGIDSLVSKYRALGIDRHAMKYVDAPAEKIPFPDKYFDFVASFNSLDHVDDLDKSIKEISRVVKYQGTFLLISEVNHPPSATEPVDVTESDLRARFSGFKIVSWRSYLTPSDHDLYLALKTQQPIEAMASSDTPVIVAARMERQL